MYIIGINISAETSKAHLKALNGGWYGFVESLHNEFDSVTPPRIVKLAPSQFFKIFPNLPDINISCVVGHNGVGKSSLIELILKVINNFSVAAFGSDDDKIVSLNFVKGIYAELFLNIDNNIYCIRNWDSEVSYYKYDNHKSRWSFNIENLKPNDVIEFLSHFCYTICINYGLHSFNSSSMRSLKERYANQHQERWFDRLFHRVDGYQVPLTLIPSRNEGVIDINNEDRLTRQRLSVLSLLMYSKGKEALLTGYIPKSIKYIFKPISTDDSRLYFLRFLGVDRAENGTYSALFDAAHRVWSSKLSGLDIPREVYESSVNYLTEKTLRICYTYSPYLEKIQGPYDDAVGLCDSLITEILQDNSYVTSKIRGTLNFLSSNTYSDKIKGEINVGEALANKELLSYNDVLQLLPPSFYVYELYYQHEEVEDITIDMLSSGERQLLFTISAVLYHLSNLSTIPTNDRNRIPYHNINLIFDEAELYFHPEFQRTFLYDLLKKISLLNLDRRKIRGINIILVTHSPFVLSDIPSSNVVYLDPGDDNSKNTFGANLYDIMKDGFVVKSGIGEVATEKIRLLFNIYNEPEAGKRRAKFNASKTELEYIANEIGEPYLQTTMTRMYQEMESEYSETEEIDALIVQAERRLAELKAKRNEKH